MNSCIYLKDVCKQYGKVKAVSGVSLSVSQGQISAFLGPNGAGKSTTMNLLATLLNPTSGQIMVEGFSMGTEKDKIKQQIGVVFQEDVLDDAFTVYENLYYRGSLYYENKQQTLNQMKEVTRILSLNELLPKRYKTCSGGQKRICQIGRALMSKPKLLLLDEPTIGLDPIARNLVWQALLKLNRGMKMTIFFSTHYMEETIHADHICIINRGNILVCGRKDWLLNKYKRTGSRTIQDIYMELLREDFSL